MREQKCLRGALAATALVCLATFAVTREQVDLVAALLFGFLIYTTGQSRSRAYLGALAAAVAVLVIRVHQSLTGVGPTRILLVLGLAFPALVVVFALLARAVLRREPDP